MNTRLAASLALAYPVAVLIGVQAGLPALPLGILATLVLVASWQSLEPRQRGLLGILLVLVVTVLTSTPGGTWLMYALPVAILGGLSALFARSLRAGHTPLITRYALAMGASDRPPVHRYTRRLTLAWALLCGTLAILSALLAVLAPTAVWALVANGLNYLLLAGLFMLEYPLRSWLLRGEPRHGFLAYLLELARVDHHRILRQP